MATHECAPDRDLEILDKEIARIGIEISRLESLKQGLLFARRICEDCEIETAEPIPSAPPPALPAPKPTAPGLIKPPSMTQLMAGR